MSILNESYNKIMSINTECNESKLTAKIMDLIELIESKINQGGVRSGTYQINSGEFPIFKIEITPSHVIYNGEAYEEMYSALNAAIMDHEEILKVNPIYIRVVRISV